MSTANPLDAYLVTELEHELTDTGNAHRFVAEHGEDVKYVPEWGWMVWTGVCWEKSDLRARRLMTDTAINIHKEAANSSDVSKQKSISEWARKSQAAPRIREALYLSQPLLEASPGQFDQQGWRLPVKNGTVDLCNGEILEHSRGDYCTRVASTSYSETNSCPEWERFLAKVLPDESMRSFVQRLVGYSLTASTEEQVLVFLYGNGRNGKSVFIETIAELMGGFHAATRIDTLCVSRGGGIPNDVAALAGARFVTVSETPEGSRLNESLVKDLTGGDTISARYLRCEYFQFKPQFKLWIRGNHKPRIRGTDDGIWRRVLLVPFTVQIPDEEVDPELSQKLKDELPGILHWAVLGCLEWQRIGLCKPGAVTRAVSDYRSEMDTLGEFITDRCVVLPDCKCPASELYSEYKSWCVDAGHSAVSMTRFGLALGERGFEKRKPKTVIWHGIGLLSDSPTVVDTSSSSLLVRAHDSAYTEQGAQLSEGSDSCPNCDDEGCSWCHEREVAA